MNFVITGCSGFIGFHVARRLLDENHNVYGIDSLNKYYDISLKKSRLRILKSYKKFRFYKFCLTDQKKIKNLVKNKKNYYFLHFAAQPGVRISSDKYNKYFSNNILAFFNILETIKLYKPKVFMFASSSSIYNMQAKIPYKEDNNISRPLSFYGATKSCNEIMSYTYATKFNIKTIALRLFTVFGPLGRPDMAYYKFANQMMDNKKIDVFNGGNSLRDFTYITDVEESILRLLMYKNKKSNIFEAYNIGRSSPVKLNYVINQISKNISNVKIKKKIYKKKIKEENKITYCDNRKLYRIIKYKPKVNIEQGIKKFVEWLIQFRKKSS